MPRRLALVSLAAMVGLGFFGPPALAPSLARADASVAVPAVASGTEGACPTSKGVTVVVDFADLGGGVYVRCTATSPANGIDALKLAGFSYKTAAQFSGFICRISNKPQSDPCISASPSNAYWSYWVAPRGGDWCYSSTGAADRTPAAGTVEGWAFAKDKAGTAIPAPRYVPPSRVSGSPASVAGTGCTAPAPTPTSPPATQAPKPAPTTAPGAAQANSNQSSGPSPAPQVGGATQPRSDGGLESGSAQSPSAPITDGSSNDTDSADKAGEKTVSETDTKSDSKEASKEASEKASEKDGDSKGSASSDESTGSEQDESATDVPVNVGDVELAATDAESTSSAAGPLVGLALIATMGVVAGVLARRRRSASSQP